MIPFGALEAGAVAHYLGTSATLAVGAIICTLAALVTLINDPPDPPRADVPVPHPPIRT